MKISGFTILRNAEKFDYPYQESISSVLPLVDEMVINLDRGDDDTEEKLKDFIKNQKDPEKFKIFYSTWPMDDEEKRKEGLILSEQTNLALEKCSYDWCFYLQADEVFQDLKKEDLIYFLESQKSIDGVVFHYHHFYGSYDIEQKTRSAYRREVRLVRKSSGAKSVGDAQSFLKGEERKKLDCALSSYSVFHYGWVRKPEAMKEKTFFMDGLYHGKKHEGQCQTATGNNYLYKKFWGLKRFRGNHPSFMRKRIQEKNWSWNFEESPFVFQWRDLKKVILDTFEKVTGIRLFEFRNYKLKP